MSSYSFDYYWYQITIDLFYYRKFTSVYYETSHDFNYNITSTSYLYFYSDYYTELAQSISENVLIEQRAHSSFDCFTTILDQKQFFFFIVVQDLAAL